MKDKKEIKNGTNYTIDAKLGCDIKVLLHLQRSLQTYKEHKHKT